MSLILIIIKEAQVHFCLFRRSLYISGKAPKPTSLKTRPRNYRNASRAWRFGGCRD